MTEFIDQLSCSVITTAPIIISQLFHILFLNKKENHVVVPNYFKIKAKD